MTEKDEFAPIVAPLNRYLTKMTEDPLRLSVLAEHALVEEMIENVIAEAVSNSECFDVPQMSFWKKLKIIRTLAGSDEKHKTIWTAIEKLNKLRNAAAHKDYDNFREERFADLANFFYPDPAFRGARSREILLHELALSVPDFLPGCNPSFGIFAKGLEKGPAPRQSIDHGSGARDP